MGLYSFDYAIAHLMVELLFSASAIGTSSPSLECIEDESATSVIELMIHEEADHEKNPRFHPSYDELASQWHIAHSRLEEVKRQMLKHYGTLPDVNGIESCDSTPVQDESTSTSSFRPIPQNESVTSQVPKSSTSEHSSTTTSIRTVKDIFLHLLSYFSCSLGLMAYFRKWGGQHLSSGPMADWTDILLSFISSFIGIATPALINFNLLYTASRTQYIFLIASFGASAVLLYALPQSDFSQPRNVIGGHCFSAIIGVSVRHLFFPVGDQSIAYDEPFLAREWAACAFAVAVAILVMNLTKTIHPPGSTNITLHCTALRSNTDTNIRLTLECSPTHLISFV